MNPRIIARTVIGLLGLGAATTMVGGRSRMQPRPAMARSIIEDRPSAAAAAPRNHVIIEPLPLPMTTVKLANVNSGEEAAFQIGDEGELLPDQAVALEEFFRCRRSGRHLAMAPGVLSLLADVGKHWPGRTIEVISGFRAPPFGAPHSKHFRGHAIDLRVRGVRTAALRDYVWRSHHGVGVGHYPETNFVHMDWRPSEPDVAWTGADEDGTPEYHPRWAWKARHPQQSTHGRAKTLAAAFAATKPL